MYRLQPFSRLSFEQAAQLFTEGFKYYFTDIQMTVDALLLKIVNEQLSPEKSLVLLDQDKPVGFLLNGFMTINGKKIAWNGGTGIIPSHRGKGGGKVLLQGCMALYQQEGITEAYLEAISENEPAIALYKQFGYTPCEQLTYYVRNGILSCETYNDLSYDSQYGFPHEITHHFPLLDHMPWQTMPQHVKGGQVLFVYEKEQPVGYALYTKRPNESITLYHCYVAPANPHRTQLVAYMLSNIFEPQLSYRRLAFNIQERCYEVKEWLHTHQFEVLVTQLHMSKKID
ncbi:acetyltransferase [Fictibacillus macauensis ZFHKF-1]|uniref:Acetyltransferase n=1 Tax=Fictibacillus macauensis ZFHKF-1 TaxID=1196324 RepID=I8J6F5_9BACL|nr:GNAT family N-acetyltransferase [Fictibacillus macauensis]EIT87401.1 acetyltransferase [Fictibacillus macauensis ZFHKF-1]